MNRSPDFLKGGRATSFLLLLSGKLVKRRPLKNETFARQLVCILWSIGQIAGYCFRCMLGYLPIFIGLFEA